MYADHAIKPVLIISHIACEHPGYLCDFLDGRNISYQKARLENEERLPGRPEQFSGVVLLGSPVSVYDPLPWIAKEIALVEQAVQLNLPVLGICFGAQLLAKALGGEVCSAGSMQIGWHSVTLTPQGKTLFNETQLPDEFEAFEWHGDTFSLPQGAVPLFTGDCIEQQGFYFENCLALQFHPEITKSMIYEWLERYSHCLEKRNPCIQNREQILQNIRQRLTEQRRVADMLFGWWLDRVKEVGAGYRQPVIPRFR